jgi:hypothetical protein
LRTLASALWHNSDIPVTTTVTSPNQRFIPVPSPISCCLNSHTDDAPRAKSSREIESMGILATMPPGCCKSATTTARKPAWCLYFHRPRLKSKQRGAALADSPSIVKPRPVQAREAGSPCATAQRFVSRGASSEPQPRRGSSSRMPAYAAIDNETLDHLLSVVSGSTSLRQIRALSKNSAAAPRPVPTAPHQAPGAKPRASIAAQARRAAAA